MPFLSKPSSEIKSLNNSDALQTAIVEFESIPSICSFSPKNEHVSKTVICASYLFSFSSQYFLSFFELIFSIIIGP